MVYLTKFTIVKVQRFESEYLNLLIIILKIWRINIPNNSPSTVEKLFLQILIVCQPIKVFIKTQSF